MPQFNMKNSAGLRLIIISVLALFLLIPAYMIQSVIRERQNNRDFAIREVSSKWGDPQIISGPILTIPYLVDNYDKDKNLISTNKYYAHFLPDNLDINGEIFPEIRYRGIYEMILYNSKLCINAKFSLPDIQSLSLNSGAMVWQEATIELGISDLKGIKDVVIFDWNGTKFTANPGIPDQDVVKSGIHINLNFDRTAKSYQFSTILDINGSKDLQFVPVGKESVFDLKSTWSDPSFSGGFLPLERSVSEEGFSAKWKIFNLNRNFPQQWKGNQHNVLASAFGVELLMPVDEYQKTMRTSKYALMFIMLTFITFFMIEIMNKKAIHPIQYLLIGVGLVIFYSLLLALSEHMRLAVAYIISSFSMIALITMYTKAILRTRIVTCIICGILVLLYTYLYIVLQLQDYALLIGNLGLFVIMGIVMFITRKLDWFSMLSSKNEIKKD
ncbi:MAG: cell envelope integrity protein CreD [Candidatus Cloacimonadales bacterium]|nr:cell envelope integrity protein CreD [Candidatus Cloacimonadales bacterium]